ncbi:flagellar hook-length control protein FliK [Bremerella alba]|uniref:Flagellar hook-length control protein-like C-terminal domain-containing protein n=1 Tax=Bremerella alba TaxID=980252 RepID=A0A7V8V8J1_9BACT|nr:flagellar hook-length control protein FliK [Bremerella alba]MBA2116898.1 hypothetical protein [Bremerella alba]
MESSSPNSVNPTPGWSGGTRANATSSSDPMAFFDLIMKSSQAMTTQGSKSFDPVASTKAEVPSSKPYTAPTDDPNLHDGYDDSPSSVGSEVRASEASDVDQTEPPSIDQDDTAADTDFSEQSSAKEETDPDQAALETAAAAGQQEQVVGPADPLEKVEQADIEEQAPADVVNSTSAKKETPPQGEVNTDQPLDTTNSSEEASGEQSESFAPPTDDSVQSSANQQDTQSFAVPEEESPVEEAEAASEVRSGDDGKLKIESLDQTAEESAQIEDNLETSDDRRDGSSEQHQKNKTMQNADNKKAGSVDVVETTATVSTDSSTLTAVTKASEALAAAASGTAPTAASPTSSNAPNTNAGVNNLSTLLQRGLQRGSLQKTEGSQTPQLDPKQQIRLINRVARAVESTPPGQSIKIRLNPSELGQLKVEIKIENGNMTAKIEAENPATRQVLLENLPQLRERLAESNINVQQFEVELMDQQTPQDGSASNFADQSDREGGSKSSRSQDAQSSSEEETTSSTHESVNKDAERDSLNLNVTA